MYSSGFELIISIVMHGRLFKDTHFVKLETSAMLADDILKLNHPINIFLINLNNILFYLLSIKHLCHIHQ